MPSDKDYKYTEVDDPTIIREEIMMPSTLEDIDTALYDYINDSLDIYSTNNKGFEKVPVIWVSAERSYQIKHNKSLRDKNGSVILPAITVERMSTTKDLNRKGGIFGNAITINSNDKQGGVITIARRIVQDKTQDNANADAKYLTKQTNYPRKNGKVVYETATIPIPIYVDVNYKIGIRTEYQQQMNEVMTPFINTGRGINHFTMLKNKHKYEGFVQPEFAMESNQSNLGDEERKYETSLNIKVLGHIIGNDKNQDPPKIVWRQNFIDIKIGRERVVFGDEPWNKSADKLDYRD
jgi:hypothetical protein